MSETFKPDILDMGILIRLGQRKTYEEIGEELEVVVSKVQYRINRMIAAGLIQKPSKKKKARSLMLTAAAGELFEQYGAVIKTS